MPEKMLQRFKKENIGVVKSRKADGESKAAGGGLFAGMSNKQLQRMIETGKIQRAGEAEAQESETEADAPATNTTGDIETARKWFEKADKLYANEDYKHAIQYYTRSLTYLGSIKEALFGVYFNIAQCNRKLERWPIALEYYKAALEVNPETEYKDEVMGHIIAIQVKMGATQNAEGLITELTREEAQTLFSMGQVAYEEKRYEKAMEYYTRVQNEFSMPDGSCYVNLAQCNRMMGRWATALHFYERALQKGIGEYTEEVKGRVLECKRKLGLPVVDDKKK